MKKSIIRQKLIPKSKKITLNVSNTNNNLVYLQKYSTNVNPIQINLNRTNISENSKNDSSLYGIKPEEGLLYSYQALVSPKKKNTVLKIAIYYADKNKILEKEYSFKIRIITNKYANYINNVRQLNHTFVLIIKII